MSKIVKKNNVKCLKSVKKISQVKLKETNFKIERKLKEIIYNSVKKKKNENVSKSAQKKSFFLIFLNDFRCHTL